MPWLLLYNYFNSDVSFNKLVGEIPDDISAKDLKYMWVTLGTHNWLRCSIYWLCLTILHFFYGTLLLIVQHPTPFVPIKAAIIFQDMQICLITAASWTQIHHLNSSHGREYPKLHSFGRTLSFQSFYNTESWTFGVDVEPSKLSASLYGYLTLNKASLPLQLYLSLRLRVILLSSLRVFM